MNRESLWINGQIKIARNAAEQEKLKLDKGEKDLGHANVRLIERKNNMINEIMQFSIDNWFMYHPPKGDQSERYIKIRAKAKELAEIIADNTPESADQTAAFRLLRECVMTANAAIACNE